MFSPLLWCSALAADRTLMIDRLKLIVFFGMPEVNRAILTELCRHFHRWVVCGDYWKSLIVCGRWWKSFRWNLCVIGLFKISSFDRVFVVCPHSVTQLTVFLSCVHTASLNMRRITTWKPATWELCSGRRWCDRSSTSTISSWCEIFLFFYKRPPRSL